MAGTTRPMLKPAAEIRQWHPLTQAGLRAVVLQLVSWSAHRSHVFDFPWTVLMLEMVERDQVPGLVVELVHVGLCVVPQSRSLNTALQFGWSVPIRLF